MNMKKVVSLFLTLTMAVSMAACGSTPESTGSDAAQPAEVVEEVPAEEAAETEAAEKNLYGYDEPIHFKMYYARGATFQYMGNESATDNTWVNLYKENNMIPELLFEVDDSQEDTKLSTAIMSGNYPDIMWANSDNFHEWIDTGVITDFTEAFEEYASDELRAYLDADGGMSRGFVTVDGKLYGIPYIGNPYDLVYLMWIRQDWLDNLGLEVPTTMEELKEVAYAFTYNDPDQNGVDDTYGLAINGTNITASGIGNTSAFFSGFDTWLGHDGKAFVEYEEGVPTWGGTNAEGMKAGLQMLQDMYKEGSIAKDFITMDGGTITEESGAGRCGIWFGSYWGGWTPQSEASIVDSNAKIIAAPVPYGLGDGESKALFTSSVSTMWVQSSKCENPELIVKLANLAVQKLCYPESAEEYAMYRGDEVNYTGHKCSLLNTLPPFSGFNSYKAVSAALESKDTSALDVAQQKIYDQITAYYELRDSGEFDPEDPVFYNGVGINTVHGDPNCAYAVIDQLEKEGRIVYNAYSAIPTDNMNENFGTLNSLLNEYAIKIILGESVDLYDEFLESWYSQGGQDIIDDVQAWYAAK